MIVKTITYKYETVPPPAFGEVGGADDIGQATPSPAIWLYLDGERVFDRCIVCRGDYVPLMRSGSGRWYVAPNVWEKVDAPAFLLQEAASSLIKGETTIEELCNNTKEM